MARAWLLVILPVIASRCTATFLGPAPSGDHRQHAFQTEASSGTIHIKADTQSSNTTGELRPLQPFDTAGTQPLRGTQPLQINALKEALSALEIMQSEFYEAWLGDWPTAIDWTAAVMNTNVLATLSSLSRSDLGEETPEAHSLRENLINRYFAQSSAFYFGEEAYSLRLQAYDDMLWVVLEWLEAIKFMNLHDKLHYSTISQANKSFSPFVTASTWHGKQFEAAFAHRAHVFYDLVNRGWDEKLCGGGLTWNPNLEPYKNAITNQLFISAAIGMYLYHPGDRNRSPFITTASSNVEDDSNGLPWLPRARAHDKRYLNTAIRAYDWLKRVNMTNAQGLYVDGYHISNLKHNNTVCDARNEMVYTYNQGVLLSGLRGLWEGTGNMSYLKDGHTLIRQVIAATGWQGTTGYDQKSSTSTSIPSALPSWAGLGRAGILHDFCDSTGTCNQDAQAFKGIFFHHLTLFCEALPTESVGPLLPNRTFVAGDEEAALHAGSCKSYIPWIARNARAALGTQDARGRMGMWWGAGRREGDDDDLVAGEAETVPPLPSGAVDVWSGPVYARRGSAARRAKEQVSRRGVSDELDAQIPLEAKDYNDRGRGRTVETQSGGLAVLRALHELIARFGDQDTA